MSILVTNEGGQSVKFIAGVLVTIKAEINCRWEIHQAVRKYYRFGD